MDDYGYEIPAQTLEQINSRFDEGSSRMGGIEREQAATAQELGATRQELHELKLQLADLLDFFGTMNAAIKVFNWVGKLAKPMTAIVGLGAACLAAWGAWRGIR
jgi:ABC-type transporter Mla subunit MlaD